MNSRWNWGRLAGFVAAVTFLTVTLAWAHMNVTKRIGVINEAVQVQEAKK